MSSIPGVDHIPDMDQKPIAIYIGTQGWTYPDWTGTFYPPDTPSTTMLPLYARTFSTVELDTTFYGPPRPSSIAAWQRGTPDSFVFAAKVPRLITHDKGLQNCADDLARFVEAMRPLGNRLGPLLVQLPPTFAATPDQRAALAAFLPLLPGELRWAVEFRHRSWYGQSTLELLRRYGVAMAAIDHPNLPRQPAVSADFTYIRWLGDRKAMTRFDRIQVDRDAELSRWAEVIRAMVTQHGVRHVFAYANNHFAGHSPATARQICTHLGLDVPPTPIEQTGSPPKQGSLFAHFAN